MARARDKIVVSITVLIVVMIMSASVAVIGIMSYFMTPGGAGTQLAIGIIGVGLILIAAVHVDEELDVLNDIDKEVRAKNH